MAVQVGIDNNGNVLQPPVPQRVERERRLLLTARRRRLARLRRTAETAAWVVGFLTLAAIAFGGLAGLR
jgi:hypothetical protein